LQLCLQGPRDQPASQPAGIKIFACKQPVFQPAGIYWHLDFLPATSLQGKIRKCEISLHFLFFLGCGFAPLPNSAAIA